jgi:hypothetical protein
MLRRVAVVVTAMLALSAARAAGQTVRGTVVDGASQRPLQGASVTLLNDAGEARAKLRSDEAGAFSVRIGSTSRAYWVRVEHPGYAIVETRPFVFSTDDGEKTLRIEMRAQVVSLEGVTARASTGQTRNYAGFLARQRAGWGRYLDQEYLSGHRVSRASDLLVGLVPGLDVVPFGPGAGTVVFRNRGRYCSPVLLVDGVSYDPRMGGPRSVDEVVQGSQIRAVEVYSQAIFVPAELSMSPFNDCGAVVIWTEYGLGAP